MLDPRSRSSAGFNSPGSTVCPEEAPPSEGGMLGSTLGSTLGSAPGGVPGNTLGSTLSSTLGSSPGSTTGKDSGLDSSLNSSRGSGGPASSLRRKRTSADEETMCIQKSERKLEHFARSEMKQFLHWVHVKHKHLVCLWHKLDKDGSMSLHKNEFSAGMKALEYGGGLERLWALLDRDTTGNISFIEFCPEAALEIARFKRWCDGMFGSAKDLFVALDSDKSGSVTFKEFEQACPRLGLPTRLQSCIRTLFMLLNYDEDGASTGSISQTELRFLDVWKPPAYLWEEPDSEAFDRFKQALLVKHNRNPLLAWRRALDRDSSMRVSYEEFLIQCKQLAKRGLTEAAPESGPTSLFVALDAFRSGWFTLQDWDAEVFEALRNVAILLRDSFKNSVPAFMKHAESLGEAWDDGPGPETGAGGGGGGGLTYVKFARALRSLELPFHQRSQLFEGLKGAGRNKAESGKAGRLHAQDLKFLTVWDPDRELQDGKVWLQLVNGQMSTTSGVTALE